MYSMSCLSLLPTLIHFMHDIIAVSSDNEVCDKMYASLMKVFHEMKKAQGTEAYDRAQKSILDETNIDIRNGTQVKIMVCRTLGK